MTDRKFFAVKGFEDFQHYKDRNPPWIKFYNTTLDDYELGKLPDVTKAHLFAIWLLASRYDNEIPYDHNWVANKINATTTIDLELLEKAGFIYTDQPCSDLLSGCTHDARLEERIEEKRRAESFFNIWWKEYPSKKGKTAAQKKYFTILKTKTATPEQLFDGLKNYISHIKLEKIEKTYIKHPTTWLNQGCWEDEYEVKKPHSKV